MRYEVIKVTEKSPVQASVTVIEKTDGGVPTGNEKTLKYDTQKKDYAELKKRFETEFAGMNNKQVRETCILTDLKNEGVENISIS